MRLEPAECRRLLGTQRVARLATIGPAGPHLIPIVFARDGADLVFAVDDKPKRSRRLQRLDNLRSDPRAAVLADHYEDDWTQLWWVRADVTATITEEARDVERVARLLAMRYEPYRSSPPRGPAVTLRVRRWTGWAAGHRGAG